MRLPRVVAGVTLIVALALVAVPGPAGSRIPASHPSLDSALFEAIDVGLRTTAKTTSALDPAYRSDAVLETDSALLEPVDPPAPAGRSANPQRAAPTGVTVLSPWRYDRQISWYGPGFYGKRTACGLAYTKQILGVAHRSLPCGTKVTFKNFRNGRTITVPVIDRGPYVAGRIFDLSGATCTALDHCYTGPIWYRFP